MSYQIEKEKKGRICSHVMSLKMSLSMNTTRITPVVHTLQRKSVEDASPAQLELTSHREQRSPLDQSFSVDSYEGPTAREWVESI